MAFYAGRVILHPAMENPTIVVLTDRNDLDDQLFGTFARCSDLLRQPPVQAADRADLRSKLAVASGGVVFTTIQKFLPEEKGDRHPGPLRAPQRRRHRRRGASQPVRLHRRIRPSHAGRAAERVLRRLHRHAHREDRRQHAGGVRQLHQRVRHPAGGRRRRNRADLLRESAGKARAEGFREAEDRSRVRGGDRRRRGRAQGEAEEPLGAAGSRRRIREPHVARGPRPGRALREPAHHPGRQGHDRVHEPPDLCRALQRAGAPSTVVGR